MDAEKIGRRKIQEMLQARNIFEPATGEELKIKGERYVACLCQNPIRQCSLCEARNKFCDRVTCNAENRKDHKDIYLKRLY